MQTSIGRYRLRELLGRGGQGEVYLAVDPDDRQVALKVLRRDVLADAESRLRFEREGELARTVVHPNVVRILDAGTDAGVPFLVCELVRGRSLSGMLEAPPQSLDLPCTLRIALGVLNGLAAIHASGLIHRDVKPGNILLDADGRSLLADLGLARLQRRDGVPLTSTGMIVGTPHYMAPEQIEGREDLDERADLYSLGVVLYRTLSGRLPFTGESQVAVLRQHLDARPPALAALCPALPSSVHVLVSSLMQRRREDRPSDAGAAMAMVERCLADSAGSAAGVTLDLAWNTPSAALPWLGTIADGGERIFPATLPDGAGAGATISDGVVPATLAEAGAETTTLQVGSSQLGRRGMARACLRHGARTTFVYGGDQLLMGREGGDRGKVDLCTRLLPSSVHADANRRISGHHCRISIRGQCIEVVDLAGRNRTSLDGTAIGIEPVALRLDRPTDLVLADVLHFRLQPVLAGRSAALWLRRVGNAEEHDYLLIHDRVSVVAEADRLRPGAAGGIELLWRDQGLWWRQVDAAAASVLASGETVSVGPLVLEVRALAAADQK